MPAPHNILEVRNVSVRFDGFTVLDQLDFALGHGELRFLIGPNGAGKTTLLDIITGKTKPTAGQVIFDGQVNLSQWQEHVIVQHGIARKFQTPAIFASLSVYENLEAAASFRQRSLQLLGGLARPQAERIASQLDMIGLTGKRSTKAGALSHGEKQWLEIGMLLIQEPKLLLLDEPVAGMTRAERNQTGALLQKIARDRAIVVVEHDMEFVRAFAKTVTVLHMGRILCEGAVEQVQRDPRVIEVYLGRRHDEVKLRKHQRAAANPVAALGAALPPLSTAVAPAS
jgi:urea transport system ATP-binding protein